MRIFPCLAALVLALLPRASPAGADADIGAGIPPSPFGAGSSIAAASDASASSAWTFSRDDVSVRQALQRWAVDAGWQLVWDIDRDFPIEAEVTLRGDFLDAIAQAMAVLRDTDYPVQARVQSTARIVRIARYLPEGVRQ